MSNLKKNIKLKEGVTLKNFINLTPKETEMVRAWRNNSSIKKWMYKIHIISAREHAEFVNKLGEKSCKFCWVIKNKNEEYIGVIILDRVDLCNKNAYLGIYRNPYSKSLCSTLSLGKIILGLAFNIAGLHTLKLEVFEDNDKASRFYRRIGFRKEGRLRNFVYKDKKRKDVIIMGILNKEKARLGS